MYALIDVGNTMIKIVIMDNNNNIFNKYSYLTDEIINDVKKITVSENCSNVLFSNVVPQMDKKIKNTFSKSKVLELKEADFINQEHFRQNVHELGSDLIASYYSKINDVVNKDFIFISFGTATVISTTVSSIFEVYSISPGIFSSLKTFNNNIKGFKINFSDLVSHEDKTETIKVTRRGIYDGHFYMINGFIKELLLKNSYKKIVITGGYQKEFNEKIASDLEIEFNENLVIDGLNFIYKNIIWK